MSQYILNANGPCVNKYEPIIVTYVMVQNGVGSSTFRDESSKGYTTFQPYFRIPSETGRGLLLAKH